MDEHEKCFDESDEAGMAWHGMGQPSLAPIDIWGHLQSRRSFH